jgi:hypothetical protein
VAPPAEFRRHPLVRKHYVALDPPPGEPGTDSARDDPGN